LFLKQGTCELIGERLVTHSRQSILFFTTQLVSPADIFYLFLNVNAPVRVHSVWGFCDILYLHDFSIDLLSNKGMNKFSDLAK